jgi:hypothetical protein
VNLPDIRRGQKIRTRDQIAMVEGIQSAGIDEAVGGGLESVTRSRTGARISGLPMPRLAVFEITAYWQWTKNDSLPEGSPARPQHWHRARAKPVVYFPGSDQRKWDGTAFRRAEWIYHHVGYCPGIGVGDPPLAARYQQREDNAFMPRSGVGDWVWCQFDPQSGLWESIEPWENTWRFKLAEALTPGGSAEAKLLLLRDGWGIGEDETGSIENATDILFEVHDPLYLAGRGAVDCVGYARRMADAGRFEIIAMRQAPSLIFGFLVGDLETTDETFLIEDCGVLQPVGSVIPAADLDENDRITVKNVHSYFGTAGAYCQCTWNATYSRYDLHQISCSAAQE